MLKYFEKLIGEGLAAIVIIAAAFANWYWPLFLWLGDTAVYRFIWLGIFFILLDILLEVLTHAIGEINLMAEAVGFSRDMKKISGSFHLIAKAPLPEEVRPDFIAVGSSGVWLVMVRDGGGDISFNGDEVVQGGRILKGLLTATLEKSYFLAQFLKKNLNGRDFKVSPVVAFSSSRANLSGMPKMVRGVYVSSRQDIISLIENTDVQLIDKNSIDEIYELLKKPFSKSNS